ncbi:MAG: hypothetical protein JHC95_23115 [Solirubrobacteraceae bacterium]|nr:hypothetical protein [Solirubrobacteraceae bacterium]
MIQHVSVDVPRGSADDAVAFWALLGFTEVTPPEALRGTWRWVEREGTQIHLRGADDAVPPSGWHVAVVVADFEATVEHLQTAGFAFAPGREIWGASRGKTTAPGGVEVELMASSPAPSPG